MVQLLPPLHVGPHCELLFLTSPSFLVLRCRRRKAGILPSLEDLLFYTIAEGQEKIPAHKFTTVSPWKTKRGLAVGRLVHAVALLLSPQALKATGLRTGDPRLKECMEMLKVTLKTTSDGALDRHLFKK